MGYSSEISTPSIRGIMGSLFQLMVVAGGVIASIILDFVKDWKAGMLMPGIAGVIVGVAIWFVPESPRFVMDKQGYDAGKETLQKVRKGNVDDAARAMQEESDHEKEAGTLSYTQLLSNPGIRRRVFVACILGLTIVDSQYGGRRSQLLVASVLMGPPLVLAGVGKVLDWSSAISIAALAIYGPAFQFAWGIIPWLYPAEIFSMNEKDRALSLSTFMCFAINFIVGYITPSFLAWSPGYTFIIFGILNISNFVFVFLFIKETKGVPLGDVPALFDKRVVSPDGKNSEMLGC